MLTLSPLPSSAQGCGLRFCEVERVLRVAAGCEEQVKTLQGSFCGTAREFPK